ncbi:MAG: N-acetyltransferase [Pseudomonadota bacterium]
MRLSTETPDDKWEVEALFDLAFAPGREALSSYRLRDGVQPVDALSRVLRDETGAVAGAVRFWPVRIGEVPALLLGPIAVHPIHQGEGLGAWLIEESLSIADKEWDRVLLVGDAPYYGRFGFQKLDGVIMPAPSNPDRVLGRALSPGAWHGITGQVLPWT